MKKKDDVLAAVNKVSGRDDIFETSVHFAELMDSMSLLEVVLVLEEKGYETTHFSIDELDTIEGLIEVLYDIH